MVSTVVREGSAMRREGGPLAMAAGKAGGLRGRGWASQCQPQSPAAPPHSDLQLPPFPTSSSTKKGEGW